MRVPSFRPHLIRKVILTGGGYTNGDYYEGAASYTACIPCRYEPNGKAETIRLQDGTNYQYHYTIYLCPDAPICFEYGDIVELFSQCDCSLGRFEVKGFHRYQLGLRLWV